MTNLPTPLAPEQIDDLCALLWDKPVEIDRIRRRSFGSDILTERGKLRMPDVGMVRIEKSLYLPHQGTAVLHIPYTDVVAIRPQE